MSRNDGCKEHQMMMQERVLRIVIAAIVAVANGAFTLTYRTKQDFPELVSTINRMLYASRAAFKAASVTLPVMYIGKLIRETSADDILKNDRLRLHLEQHLKQLQKDRPDVTLTGNIREQRSMLSNHPLSVNFGDFFCHRLTTESTYRSNVLTEKKLADSIGAAMSAIHGGVTFDIVSLKKLDVAKIAMSSDKASAKHASDKNKAASKRHADRIASESKKLQDAKKKVSKKNSAK